MKVIFLGAPGAGKDTLADKFKLQYSYNILSPGSIFRQQAADKTDLGLKARDEYWGKGLLCPDELTNELVKNTINKLDKDKLENIIFNGYPRSLEQAKFLQNIMSVTMVVDLIVDEEIAVKRILRRGREDDLEDIIRERFVQYKEKTQPISNFYMNLPNCIYVSINANATPQNVFQEAFQYFVQNAVEKLNK